MNLHNLLTRILADSQGQPGSVNITQEERDFIQEHLKQHDIELHFWANRTTVTAPNGDPVYFQHLYAKGEAVDLFSLLSEAAMCNANLAELIDASASFMRDHVPNCPACGVRHIDKCVPTEDWNFNPKDTTLIHMNQEELGLVLFCIYAQFGAHLQGYDRLTEKGTEDLKQIRNRLFSHFGGIREAILSDKGGDS